MPIYDIKIEILILYVTFTYDLDPRFFCWFQFKGSSGVYIVNFIALAEETTKMKFLLKMDKITKLLVYRIFDPRYPKAITQHKNLLAMCHEEIKGIY